MSDTLTDGLLIDLPRAAARAGVTVRTFRTWIYDAKDSPQAVKISGRLYFRPGDVDAWVAAKFAEQAR